MRNCLKIIFVVLNHIFFLESLKEKVESLEIKKKYLKILYVNEVLFILIPPKSYSCYEFCYDSN